MSHVDLDRPFKQSEFEPARKRGLWTPPPEVTNHLGEPIPGAWEFFAPPPDNIGALIAAGSTLTHDEEPWSAVTRGVLALVLAAAAVGAVVGLGVAFEWEPFIIYIAAPISALLVGGITWAVTAFEHSVTFVGDQGCARIYCSGDRDALSTIEIFRFDRAAELRTAETHHYKNGNYQSTSYSYDWSDLAGNSVYSISGSHSAEYGMPEANDDYCYAHRAEIAWSQHLFDTLLQPIEKGGFAQFNLSGGEYVRVGQGWCEFHLGGQTERVNTRDMTSAEISAGYLTIKRLGAEEGWFSSTGVFTFAYSDIANARLFLLLFEHFAAPGGEAQPTT